MGYLPNGVADSTDSMLAVTRTRSSLRGTTKPKVHDHGRDKETRIPAWDLGRDIYYDSIAIGYNLILVTY